MVMNPRLQNYSRVALLLCACCSVEAKAQTKTYVIASSNNFPPVNFINVDGKLSGFGKELSTAVAKAAGISVTYKHSDQWTEVLQWLQNGDADFLHDAGYTSERDKTLDFSDPILEMPEIIIVRKGRRDIQDLDSLQGKKVACVNEHISHQYLKTLPGIQCHLVGTPAQALSDLVAGYVDAFVYPAQVTRHLAFQLRLEDQIDYVSHPLRILTWSMVVREGNAVLLQQLNFGLAQVKSSGEYNVIYDKWFGSRVLTGYTQQEYHTLLFLSVLIGILLLTIVILFNYRKLKLSHSLIHQEKNRYRQLTEQLQQSEEQLEQQNHILESIFTSLPDAIILTDHQQSIVMLNPSAEKMFGYTQSEITGQNLQCLCNTNKVMHFSLENTEHVSQFQIEFKRKNGSIFTAKVFGVKKTPPTGFANLLFIKDISQQLTSESYLRRLNRTLTTFIETRHVIIRSDNERQLLQGICEVLINTGGYRFAWVGILDESQTCVQPLVQAGTENGYLEQLRNNKNRKCDNPIETAIRSGNTCVSENLLKDAAISPWKENAAKSGFASSVTLPLYKEGIVFGCLNIYADKPSAFDAEELNLLEELADDVSFGISAQSAKSELDLAILQRASIMDSVQDVVYQISPQGKLVFWNQRFSLVSGYSHAELENMDALNFFPEEQRLLVSDAIQRCFDLGYTEVEASLKTKDGTLIPYQFSGSPTMDENQNIIGITGVGRDLTDSKQAEQEKLNLQTQLQHAQKMESIGQLTGGIAHDFNNILASIMGYTTLVMDFITRDSNEKLNSYLQQVMKASERARDLVKQMLAFSRGTETELKSTSLLPLLQESINMLQSTLPSTVEITQDNQEGIPKIMADSVQLNQVVLNLCINARDAMNNKGTIRIETKNTNLKRQECSSCHHVFSGDFVELSIGDTGKGLSPDILGKVFEPFFTTKEIGKGSGMGLAMVHGIIHKHNGHILVESEAEKGTRFRLLFPKNEVVSIEEGSNVNKVSGHIDAKHILVVDDEAPVALFEGELLKGLGYNVSIFTSSSEAFRCFEEKPDEFDLVITDQTMPDLTGGEMAEAMLSIRPEIPILLCTGFSNSLSPQQAANIGIQGYFHKPLNKDALLRKIEELI